MFMPGMDPAVPVLYPERMLAPLKPLLMLPEVIDPTKWKKGNLWFVDPEDKFVLRVFSHITTLLHINTDQVKPGEIQSAKDLLNPKWKGKIALEDPTTAGSGSNQAARIYAQLGEEFFKRLYIDQKPFITRERRQLSDSLARGTYPITFNAQGSEVERMRKEGFPITDIMELVDLPRALTGSPWLLTLRKTHRSFWLTLTRHSYCLGYVSCGARYRKSICSLECPSCVLVSRRRSRMKGFSLLTCFVGADPRGK
jgi:hypothetical protein